MATSKIKNVNFISKMYKANVTVQPHAYYGIVGSDLGMVNVPGYTAVAVVSYYTGNNMVTTAAFGFATGNETAVVLQNNSDEIVNTTFQIRVLFVRSDYYKFYPYGS